MKLTDLKKHLNSMEKRELVALISKLYKESKQSQSIVVSDRSAQKKCGTSITKFSGLRKLKADVLNSGRFPLYSGRFPQIVQSGCIFAAPSPIPRKNLRFRASKKPEGNKPYPAK